MRQLSRVPDVIGAETKCSRASGVGPYFCLGWSGKSSSRWWCLSYVLKNEEICLVGKRGRKGLALEAEKGPESWRVRSSVFMSVYLWGVWESGQGRMCGKERGGWRPHGKHSCLSKQYELYCVSPGDSTEVFLQGNCLCFVGSWWYLPGAIIRESLEITEADPTRGFSVLVCHGVPCFSAAFSHSTPWSGNTGHC